MSREVRSLAFSAFRFAAYGVVAVFSEVLFYNIVRISRLVPGLEMLFRFGWEVDPQLGLGAVWSTPVGAFYGQCSLWMFPVYAGAIFFVIEPLSRQGAFRRRPAWARGAVLGLAILLYEGLAGLGLRALTGFDIWVYRDSLALFGGATSLAILPVWCVAGLLGERLASEVNHPLVREAFVRRLIGDEARPAAGVAPESPAFSAAGLTQSTQYGEVERGAR